MIEVEQVDFVAVQTHDTARALARCRDVPGQGSGLSRIVHRRRAAR